MSDNEEVEVEQTQEEEVDFASMSKRKQRKHRYRKKLVELLNTYQNCLVISVDNVGSNQMQQVRAALRGKAIVIMGKNTIIRKVLREFLEEKPELENLLPYIKGNMGLVFTDDDLNQIRKEIVTNQVPAAARTGIIAPCDVIIPPGPTGLDPGQTSFFQALNIATKIVRGSIEIITKVHLIKVNEKVSSSAVALLGKLNIKPFFFGIKVNQVYEAGTIYDADVLDLTDADLLKKWYNGVRHVAALSFVVGVPTEANISHIVIGSFRKLVALALETEYTFPILEELKAGGGGDSDSDDEDSDEDEDDSSEEESESSEAEELSLFD